MNNQDKSHHRVATQLQSDDKYGHQSNNMIFDTGDDDMRYFHLCIHCKGNISAKISTQLSHTFCQQTIFYLNNVSKQQI